MWNTRLVLNFPCNVPIIGAPMAGHSGGKLAAEVCRAGGLGFIGVGHWLAHTDGEDKLRKEIEILRTYRQNFPICLGFICHSTFRDHDGWNRFEKVLERYQPAVVQFFAPAICKGPNGVSNVQLAKKYDIKVLAQVGTYKEAIEAVNSGVDGLIVQGSEAGGHGVRREFGNGTLSLVATVTSKFPNIPVIAAGGIVDGRTMAAALMLGSDGVVLGTRLWASKESMGHVELKDRIIASESCDQVIRTTTFDQIQNTYTTTPWPEPFDSVGAIRNITSEKWGKKSNELATALKIRDDNNGPLSTESMLYKHACDTGNADIAVVLSGEGVGMINNIEPAFDIITRIANDASTIIRSAPKQLLM